MTIDLRPWLAAREATAPDQVKRAVYQRNEEDRVASLPHVVDPLPVKRTVQGTDSPHQNGDHVSYEMLARGPHFLMTSHFTDIAPNAPVRGIHRHISAPTLFCLLGRGWEWNDGVTWDFETYDLLVVPPYTQHQHGGDKDMLTRIYVPETGRVHHLLGLTWREQHKLSEKPTFPEGTEPMYADDGKLRGYRIKRGVLGIDRDIEVILGTEPQRDATFSARRSAGAWEGPVENTYDRYRKLMHDEVEFCRTVTHTVHEGEQEWERSRHGKIKWLIAPDMASAANHKWIYLHEIAAGSRSGRHRHAAEELVLVLEGRGYDVHDGQRWNWEKGQLIMVPAMTDHQHFNTGGGRSLALHAMAAHYTHLGLGGIEHLEDAPEEA